MSIRGDKYRALANEQAKSSQAILGGVDPTSEQVKFDLAVMSHVKAVVYEVAAELFDELDVIESKSPREKRQDFHQRMRLAAVRNDDAAMDALLKEYTEGLDDGN